MIFFFGSAFYGKVGTYNDQWIETKFFHFMFIPLFPVSSIYVTGSDFRSRSGLDIGTNGKSIRATYARLFTAAIAVITFYLGFLPDIFDTNFKLLMLTTSVTTAVLWVYFCFFYGKAKKSEYPMRDKVGSITGFYALPHMFDHAYLFMKFEDFEKKYRILYPGDNWKADLMTGGVNPERYQMLYALALFNFMVDDEPENDTFYAKADALYEI
jgi:hypothetical protein